MGDLPPQTILGRSTLISHHSPAWDHRQIQANRPSSGRSYRARLLRDTPSGAAASASRRWCRNLPRSTDFPYSISRTPRQSQHLPEHAAAASLKYYTLIRGSVNPDKRKYIFAKIISWGIMWL